MTFGFFMIFHLFFPGLRCKSGWWRTMSSARMLSHGGTMAIYSVSVCLATPCPCFFTSNLQVYNFFWYNNGDFQAPQKRKVWGPVGPGLYSSCSQVCHLKFCFENLQCSHSQWCDELIANWIYVHIKLITVYINYSIELPWYYAALQVNESQEEE
jgi:hypothetical protein